MALEFNINPAKTFNEFNRNIDSVLDEFRKVISPEMNSLSLLSLISVKNI